MLTSTLLALLLAAPADSAPRTLRPVAHPPMHVAPSLPAADTTSQLFDRALQLMVRERWQAARDLFRTAAAQQARAGASPVQPLRRVADTYYFAGQHRMAALALREVADSAAAFGDVAGQADALVDAAVVYGALGDATAAADMHARATRLLASPYFPAERAAGLRARLAAR